MSPAMVSPPPARAQAPCHYNLTHHGHLRQSLRAYDRRFGLQAAHLRFDTTLDRGIDTNCVNDEELEDVEMVHAIAPAATIEIEAVRRTMLSPRVVREAAHDS